MKRYLSVIFILAFTFNGIIFAQDSAEESAEISTVEALLMLVKEGKTKEQTENSEREAKFLASKNKQAEILAAEKRELARQERIADQLEAEYKKNEEIFIPGLSKSLETDQNQKGVLLLRRVCLLYTSPSPRDRG